MATRVATVTIDNDKTGTVSWVGLLNGDVGQSVDLSRYADKTLVFHGTPGVGYAAQFEGSHDDITFGILSDPQGVNLSTAANLVIDVPIVVSESPKRIRPKITAGDGNTSVSAYVHFTLKGA